MKRHALANPPPPNRAFRASADGSGMGHALQKQVPDPGSRRLQRQRHVCVGDPLRRRSGGGLCRRPSAHVRPARGQGPRGQRARAGDARERVSRREVPGGYLPGRSGAALGESFGVATQRVHGVRGPVCFLLHVGLLQAENCFSLVALYFCCWIFLSVGFFVVEMLLDLRPGCCRRLRALLYASLERCGGFSPFRPRRAHPVGRCYLRACLVRRRSRASYLCVAVLFSCAVLVV